MTGPLWVSTPYPDRGSTNGSTGIIASPDETNKDVPIQGDDETSADGTTQLWGGKRYAAYAAHS
jgi:hypothetical protein